MERSRSLTRYVATEGGLGERRPGFGRLVDGIEEWRVRIAYVKDNNRRSVRCAEIIAGDFLVCRLGKRFARFERNDLVFYLQSKLAIKDIHRHRERVCVKNRPLAGLQRPSENANLLFVAFRHSLDKRI